MPSERVAKILRSKTNLSEEKIQLLSDAEGWSIIYESSPRKKKQDTRTRVTLTGFDPDIREEIALELEDHGFRVMSGMAKSTEYLIVGPFPGDKKVADAERRNLPIMSWEEFQKMMFLEDGEKEDSAALAEIACIGFSEKEVEVTKILFPGIIFSKKINGKTNYVFLGSGASVDDVYDCIESDILILDGLKIFDDYLGCLRSGQDGEIEFEGEIPYADEVNTFFQEKMNEAYEISQRMIDIQKEIMEKDQLSSDDEKESLEEDVEIQLPNNASHKKRVSLSQIILFSFSLLLFVLVLVASV